MINQLDIFGSIKNTTIKIELQNGKLQFFENFFDQKQSDNFFGSLLENIHWHQDKIKMYGKELKVPRLSAWYGDSNMSYSYSGIKLSPKPWTTELLTIKNEIDKVANVKFNSVLLNRYRDGNDSVSWHSDDEPELGKNPIIGSLNFGATRRFMLRHKNDKSLTYEIELKHGSFLLMFGELQHYWIHQVPKTAKKIGERVNLTFRVIK